MKRFFCTICKKLKSVRRMPSTVLDPSATKPEDRVGQCRFHGSGMTRAEINDRVTNKKHLGSTRKITASTQKTKSKRG